MNLKVLKNKNLVLVILGQFVSGFGTFMQNFALSLYVLQKTGSAALFSSVMALSIIPRVVLTPIAGVVADRFSRKKMIVLMDMVSAFAVAIFCGIYIINGELNLISIYILTMLLSAINSFFTPSMSAIVPDIVPREQLADVNSIGALPQSILGLISPLAGGVLFGMFGLFPIMVINAVSFFASSISEMFIKIKKESITLSQEHEPYFASFKQGLRFIKSKPEILLMVGVAVIANFALSPVFSVALPVVLLQDFKVSEELYGLFNSLTTIGMLIAPIFAAKLIKKHHYSKLVWIILTFDGILTVVIAALCVAGIFSTVMINYVSMIVVINILIVTIVWVNLAISTATQLIVPGDILGRVSSVIGTFSMIATPLGIALMGMLLEVGKSYYIIAVYAAVLTAVGFASKLGFASLERKGKMDVTVGVEPPKERIEENA
jgi:MFS family permease